MRRRDMRVRAATTAALVSAVALVLLPAAARADELRLVTDQSLKGTLSGAGADGKLRFRGPDGSESTHAGEDVIVVELGAGANPPSFPAPADARWVRLVDGGRLAAKSVTLAEDGSVVIESVELGQLKATLDAVTGVRFGDARSPEDFAKRMEELIASRPTKDVMLATGGAKLLELEGRLKTLSPTELVFHFQEQDRKANLGKVFGVVVAPGRKPKVTAAGPDAVADLADGSRLPGKLVKVTDDTLVLAPAGLPEVTLKRARVQRLWFSSGRLVNLSDVDPAKEKQTPYFGDAAASAAADLFKWRKNRSLRGKSLRIGGEEFRSGIAMHAYTELTYDLGGKFEKFSAKLGIDDDVQVGGHVVFRVLLDGKEAFKQSVTLNDRPVTLELSVEGAKTMVLVADWGGDNFGVGDHAIWAGARLLKKKAAE